MRKNEAAQMGLSSILTAQGKDLNAAKAWLKSYTKDGLIPMMDATPRIRDSRRQGIPTSRHSPY